MSFRRTETSAEFREWNIFFYFSSDGANKSCVRWKGHAQQQLQFRLES